MSHFKEREEKICLNCNAELDGKFCHKCGQENREPKSTVWGLITHFFYDITHFDGKFFSTTGRLIARPGLLPKEYIKGRRASMLDPIRMYIFSSAFFFLIFFSVYNVGDISDSDFSGRKQTEKVLDRAKEELLQNANTRKDSLAIEEQFAATENRLIPITPSDSAKKDSAASKVRTKRNWKFSLTDIKYTSREQYDSVQKALPAGRRDNWLERRTMYRVIEINKRAFNDEQQFWKEVIYKFVHSFPYLLFVSLPLYALILKLLYVRRKRFYYVDHGLFLIFLYIFTFIFLLIFLGIDEIGEATGWGWTDYILVAMFFWGIYYAWRAMKKFYEQGWFKTTFKFLLFNLMCFVSLIVLFGLFFILTIFSL